MVRRATTIGVLIATVVVGGCTSRPKPTFEYDATQTYTSTAADTEPRLVPPAEPALDRAPVAAQGVPAAEGDVVPDPGEAPPADVTPDPGEAPESDVPAVPGQWYKAKPW